MQKESYSWSLEVLHLVMNTTPYSPSGVLGVLDVSSEPRLLESVLLKQRKSQPLIAQDRSCSSPDVAACVSVARLLVREHLDVFVKVEHLFL